MTIKDLQDLVRTKEEKEGLLPGSELALTALLTTQTANLTQLAAKKIGSPKANPDIKRQMSTALAQTLWTITALANAAAIDLTDAVVDNLPR